MVRPGRCPGRSFSAGTDREEMGAAEAMNINGDEYSISPEVWAAFEEYWGDKAYRQAGMVEMIEMKVRGAVSREAAE